MKNLASLIEELTAVEHYLTTRIQGLSLFRKEEKSEPLLGAYEPSVCLIAQGSKRVQMGERIFNYDPNNYLFSGLHLPVIAQVTSASTQEPYLGLSLKFDYAEIAKLVFENNMPLSNQANYNKTMATGILSEDLIDAFIRLVRLLNNEKDIPILAPMIKREIYYRLLCGEQGGTLREVAAVGTESHQIMRSIVWLKENFDKSIKIEDLANIAGMSISGFHKYFKTMTSLSPIQYQKQLRLQEARKLMLFENSDATNAAYRVGYESTSQFNREYSRLFGAPPARDLDRLKLHHSH